jgi:hypothetical protein
MVRVREELRESDEVRAFVLHFDQDDTPHLVDVDLVGRHRRAAAVEFEWDVVSDLQKLGVEEQDPLHHLLGPTSLAPLSRLRSLHGAGLEGDL